MRPRVARDRFGCHDLGAVPTYDYQCRSCGAVIEVIHPMSEDGPSVCEVCGGALRRVLFPAGIIFKGPGFYRTDSRSSSDGGSSSSTAGETAAKPAASSDTPKSDASTGAPASSSSKPKGETSG
jgi:putative FmdB family regulatory protein